MFSGEEIATDRYGLPRVVSPTRVTCTRSEFASISSKYSTICSHRASFSAVPIEKPKNSSGEGIGSPVLCGLGSAATLGVATINNRSRPGSRVARRREFIGTS